MRVLASKKKHQSFPFFPPANEKHRKSAGFQKKISTWSVIATLFYMWVNIDTKGHKKAPKSRNITPLPPRVITRIQNPGWERVKLARKVKVKWCRCGRCDALMHVLGCSDSDAGCCDASPLMLWCRSLEVQILETETLLGKVGPLLGKINVIGWRFG